MAHCRYPFYIRYPGSNFNSLASPHRREVCYRVAADKNTRFFCDHPFQTATEMQQQPLARILLHKPTEQHDPVDFCANILPGPLSQLFYRPLLEQHLPADFHGFADLLLVLLQEIVPQPFHSHWDWLLGIIFPKHRYHTGSGSQFTRCFFSKFNRPIGCFFTVLMCLQCQFDATPIYQWN
jgi:hypothetical protein